MKCNILFILFILLLLHLIYYFIYFEKIKNNKEKFENNKILKYTISGKTDGFGAQYLSIMSGIALCNYKNYIYIHTPIKKVSHNQDNKLLNKFIGIPKNNNEYDIKEEYSSLVHWSKNPDKFYTDKVINIIRKYYYSTSKPNIPNTNYIAIHIRRGDVNKNMKNRYNSNEYYIKIIKKMRKLYPNLRIKILSEGTKNDFKELGNNLDYHLNEELTHSFHMMVRARVLVMAKSSLSYCAAILNENIIYYIPFGHYPLKKWIIL